MDIKKSNLKLFHNIGADELKLFRNICGIAGAILRVFHRFPETSQVY